MSRRESIPGDAAQADPSAVNQVDSAEASEQLAAHANEVLEGIYDVVISGKTGIRHAFAETFMQRPEDEAPTPALYIEGIAFATDHHGEDAPVNAVLANSNKGPFHIPSPWKGDGQHLDQADVTLTFDRGESAKPSDGREGRANLTRLVRLVTRSEESGHLGEPLYEDVAFMQPGDPDGEYIVRRNNLSGAGETNYNEGPHADATEFARITNEASGIVLDAARRRAMRPLAEARAVVEACDALDSLSRGEMPVSNPAS